MQLSGKMKMVLALGLFLTTGLLYQPTLAQATSEAKGKIVDHEGNPIQGVTVIFAAESNPTLPYKGKTNKKGRYFVPGLFSGKEQDRWTIRVESGDMVPVEMRVESRSASRTLIGDVRTVKLNPGATIPPIPIRPLGSATVDFKIVPADQVSSFVQTPAAAEGTAGNSGAPARGADAWDSALTFAQDGDYDAATPMFEKAIEDEPEDAERRKAYAQVLYKLERFDDAATQAQKAIELEPENASNRMVLYTAQVGKGDLDGAKTTLEEAKRIAPDNIDILRQVAFVAAQNGSEEEQIQAQLAVVAVAPEDTEAWVSLGDLYARTGDLSASEEAYQKVVSLDPSNAHQVFFNLGALLMNSDNRSDQDTKKAINAFRKAVEINPKYSQAYKELAFALLNVGDRAGAREALESYINVAPNAPDAAQMKKIMETLPKA